MNLSRFLIRLFSAGCVCVCLCAISRAGPLDCWNLAYSGGSFLQEISFADGLWVAAGQNSILTSSNAVTWTQRFPAGNPLDLYDLARGDGLFVAVGGIDGTTNLMVSSDAVTWTRRSAGPLSYLLGVTYANGRFVAVGQDPFNGLPVITTSTNGVAWSNATVSGAGGLTDVKFGNGLFVAVGDEGAIVTSTDGVEWHAQNSGTNSLLTAITYAQGLFVVVSVDGAVLTSADGTNWASHSTGGGVNLYGIGYGAGQFLAVGFSSTVFSSTDGTNWSPHAHPASDLYDVAFGQNSFVTAGGSLWQASLLTNQAPVIAQQPADTTVRFHETATFTVTYAGCDPPAYQWFKEGNPAVLGRAATLQIPTPEALDGGRYFAVLSNALGGVVSQMATLTVLPPETGDVWHWRGPLPQGNDFTSIAAGGGRYVAVGLYGTIAESTDGLAWNVRSLEIDVSFTDVTYANGTFVAVGYTSVFSYPAIPRPVIFTSVNGIHWIEQTLPPNTPLLNAVTYGNGLFVAVGNNSYATFLTSPDGIGWTLRSAAGADYLYDITFGQGQFVAVGYTPNGTPAIQTSTDGLQWTSRPAGSNGPLQRVAYGNGRFVAVAGHEFFYYGSNALAVTSTDGLTWTAVTFPVPDMYYTLTEVAFGNGQFVLLGKGYGTNTVLMTSPDGVTWATRTGGAVNDLYLRTLTYANGRFVGAGEHGNLGTSTDAVAWTFPSFGTANNFRGVTYGGGQFVAVGNEGICFTSPDGASWLQHSTGQDYNLHHVLYAAGTYVAVGDAGVLLTSYDAAQWTARTSNTSEDLFDLAYGNGRFVAVGGHKLGGSALFFAIVTSTDGVNWTSVTNGSGLRLHGVTYANGLFVAVGQTGVILTSIDGLTWVRRIPSPNFGYGYFKSVAYGNGRFVTMGEQGLGLIAYSDDGVTWSTRSDQFAPLNQVDELIFGHGQFIAVGDHGLIVTSTNGLDWTTRHPPTREGLRSIAAGNGNFVIVGNNDIILHTGPGVSFNFSNGELINILDHQPAVPYPSTIAVSGFNGPVDKVIVTLNGFTHRYPSDVAVLLVAPDGQAVILMNSAGGSTNVSGLTLAFDDEAPLLLPDENAPVSGAYRPSVYSPARLFDPPAPPGPYGAALSVLNGLNPNGLWKLFVYDAADEDVGSIAAGWTLTLYGSVASGSPPECEAATTWFAHSPGITRTFQDVAYGNGTYVAVGNELSLSSSTNGLSWFNQFQAGAAPYNAVAHGNGLFVAAGFGVLRTSTNGFNWNNPLAVGGVCSGVAFGGGVFAICASNGIMFTYHTNAGGGVVIQRHISASTWNSLAYGNNRFVAVGNAGAVLVSTNGGTNWVTASADTAVNLIDVTYGQGLFVAVGPGGLILNSIDGFNWGQWNSGSVANFRGVTFGNGRFVAMSDSSPNAGDRISISSDGFNWHAYPLPFNGLNDVAFGNNGFIAVGTGGTIIQSLFSPVIVTQPQGATRCVGNSVTFSINVESSCPISYQWRRNGENLPATGPTLTLPFVTAADAGSYTVAIGGGALPLTSAAALLQVQVCSPLEQWQVRSLESNGPALNAILCDGGLRVAAGASGTIRRSTDGSNWVAVASGTNAPLNGLAYGAGRFVAVGFNGVILSSPDAGTWTPQVAPTNRTLRGLAYGANRFVAVGDAGTILVSSNGADWALVDVHTNRNFLSVRWLNNLFLVTGNTGFLLTSPDGLVWTVQSSGTTLTPYNSAWGAGQFVVVGNGGLILTSSNAINWTQRTSPFSGLLHAVVWDHGVFMAVGANGTAMTSPDGIQWTLHNTGTTLTLNDLVYCGHTYLAAGDDQLILETPFAGPPVVSGRATQNGFELGLSGELGTAYRVQATTNVGGGPWSDVRTITNVQRTTFIQENIVTNAPRRFYRAVTP